MKYSCRCLNIKFTLAQDNPTHENEYDLSSMAGDEIVLLPFGINIEYDSLVQLKRIDSTWISLKCLICNISPFALQISKDFFQLSDVFKGAERAIIGKDVLNSLDIQSSVDLPNYSHAFRIILPPDPPTIGNIQPSSSKLINERMDSFESFLKVKMSTAIEDYTALLSEQFKSDLIKAEREKQILLKISTISRSAALGKSKISFDSSAKNDDSTCMINDDSVLLFDDLNNDTHTADAEESSTETDDNLELNEINDEMKALPSMLATSVPRNIPTNGKAYHARQQQQLHSNEYEKSHGLSLQSFGDESSLGTRPDAKRFSTLSATVDIHHKKPRTPVSIDTKYSNKRQTPSFEEIHRFLISEVDENDAIDTTSNKYIYQQSENDESASTYDQSSEIIGNELLGNISHDSSTNITDQNANAWLNGFHLMEYPIDSNEIIQYENGIDSILGECSISPLQMLNTSLPNELDGFNLFDFENEQPVYSEECENDWDVGLSRQEHSLDFQNIAGLDIGDQHSGFDDDDDDEGDTWFQKD